MLPIAGDYENLENVMVMLRPTAMDLILGQKHERWPQG